MLHDWTMLRSASGKLLLPPVTITGNNDEEAIDDHLLILSRRPIIITANQHMDVCQTSIPDELSQVRSRGGYMHLVECTRQRARD